MEWVETSASVTAVIVAIMAIFGGLISFFTTIRSWSHERRPRGSRGVRFIYVGRDERSKEYWEYHFLALGDLEQILLPAAEQLTITHIGKVGEYYEFKGVTEAGRELSMARKRK